MLILLNMMNLFSRENEKKIQMKSMFWWQLLLIQQIMMMKHGLWIVVPPGGRHMTGFKDSLSNLTKKDSSH
jgi:hypothetical protein